MSTVYRGQDERLERRVCIKVFLDGNASEPTFQTSYAHFIQEAFALSQLQHPNTIRVYDFGFMDDALRSRPFYVAELMDGGTLQGRIRRNGPLSPATTLEMLEPIVGALAEAHARGIIHRDIKPSNILFGRAGPRTIVKLADFGIAKAFVDADMRSIPNRAEDTQIGVTSPIAFFSPGWAAPEQLQAHPVAPTTDVFSLGLLTAFMLSGRAIFPDRDVGKIVECRSRGDAFVEAEVQRFGLPRALAEVVVRACREESAERFPTADAYLAGYRDAVNKVDPHRVAPHPHPRVAGPLVMLDLTQSEVQVAGERVMLVRTDSEQLELGGPGDVLSRNARVRVALLPGNGGVHLKGLNCFLLKEGGRATGAVQLPASGEVEMVGSDRRQLDRVRVTCGKLQDGAWIFPIGQTLLGIPAMDSPRAALFDFGPGGERIIVYQKKEGSS
jgi:serine/threonine-protein kinase